MEQINFNYSLKNVPLPSKNTYLKTMISKLESFIKCIWWKALFFEKPSVKQSHPNFGFKSSKTPPQSQHLNAFENDLYDMIKNIEFKNVPNQFQQQLRTDSKMILKSDKVIVAADKTNNLYKLPVKEYNKLLNDNITKTYKKASPAKLKKINKEAKQLQANYTSQTEFSSTRNAALSLQ